MRRMPFLWFFFALAATAVGCFPPATHPAPSAHIEAPGLQNVFRITDNIYCGSAPEGDEGFASLQRLGVKTVITVDGASPEVERAHKFGMRYVHLPIGYDGVPVDQGLRIAKAARDMPGRIYIHCHHGQHRGPAAVAVAHLCLDANCSVEQAVAEMRRAGTDPRYKGLYAAPQQLHRPTAEELDRVPSDFPESVQIEGLARLMVEVDDRWDHLKLVRAAGWKSPPDQPDLDPPHEALQLLELYREAGRPAIAQDRPGDFQKWRADAEAGAEELEALLRKAKEGEIMDHGVAETAFQQVSNACTHCHGKYRDVPQGPQ